ncbi:hypothetical protein [Spirochaeta dissipatitropha]
MGTRLHDAETRGIKQGMKKGMQKKAREAARKMRDKGLDISGSA